jgi:hypothetical protein
MKKSISVLIILTILMSMFVNVYASEPILPWQNLPIDKAGVNLAVYKYKVIFKGGGVASYGNENKIQIVYTNMPIKVKKDATQEKYYFQWVAENYTSPDYKAGYTRRYLADSTDGFTTWKIPNLTTNGFDETDATYSNTYNIYGEGTTILDSSDIYFANYDIMEIDANGNDIGTFRTEPILNAYNMKVFDLDANAIMEYEFETMPTYGGVGLDSVKLYYTGNLTVNGTEPVFVNNQLFRVKTFYNKNFTIKDSNGRTVMILKKGGYLKLKSRDFPDTQGVMIDAWSTSVKIIFNSNNMGEDGVFNKENAYDWNVFQPLQVYVQAGLIAFKTFHPELYSSSGPSENAPTDPTEEIPEIDPIYEDEQPDPTNYEDSVFGKINYSMDMVAYYISLPFKFILRMLGELVTFLTDTVNSTVDIVRLLTKLFGFLPTTIQTTIGGLFTIITLVTVYRLRK